MVENDPFAEFGGEEVKSKPTITQNPFSEFGGTEIDETVKKKDATINSNNGLATSSNSASQSKSQSQNKLASNQISPDFSLNLGFPIQKPVINLKSNEQEQRIMDAKKSKEQPTEKAKSVLGKGTTVVPKTIPNTTIIEYQVDITDKSADATKTQVKQQAQIQNDVDTGVLEQRNKSTYQGASKDFKDKATEIAGGDLIEYSKVLGVDDDMLSRVDDNDKQIYQTNEQLKNLYANLDIYNTRGDVNNAKQIQKSIDEAEKVNAELMLKRNSQLDAEILKMQKQLASGMKTVTKEISAPQQTIYGQTPGGNEVSIVAMSDDEKTAIKSQIESLKKRKGAFLQDTENPQEVFQSLQPKITMYEKQNIIPKNASSLDKMRIYYGIKLTQLKELKKQSELENSSVLIQQNPILKALGIDTEKIGTQVVNSIKQRLPFVDDKTTKSIQEIEGELNAIAPILANNLSPNTKKSGFWKTAKNEFVDALSATTTNNTSQDNARFIQKATQEAGVNLTEDRQKELALQPKGKDYAQNNERFGQTIGNTAAFALEFGVTSALGEGLINYGAKLLKATLPAKAYVGLNMANNALRETKLGNLVLGATDEAIKYEVAGALNKQLKDNATASQGATGFLGSELGEKFAKPIATLFGANGGKFVSLLGDTFGRTVVELFEETGQNTAQLVNQVSGDDSFVTGVFGLFKDSEKGKEFISKLKENYSDADENVQFVASIFAMSFAFNAGKFGKFFTDLALKKKEELSETDKEKVDVIIDDLSDEYKKAETKAIENIAESQGKSKEDVVKGITEQATDVNLQVDEFGDGKTVIDQITEKPIVEEPIDKAVEVPAAEMDNAQLDEIFETKIANPDVELDNIFSALPLKNKVDESKTTPTESVDTGQKQDNITGVQQNEQNGGTIQQGNGQNESDQKEIQVTAEEKINPLESKIKKKIPTEKVEEKVDEILSTKNEEITPKSSIEVDRNVDRVDNNQENIELELKGKELVGDALDRIANKIGGKKNLTEQEKTSLTKDITDLAKGLLQEGKATIDNIIDKIIDAIKKRLPDLDEKDVRDLADTVNDKVIFSEGVKWYKENGYTYEQTQKRLDEIDADYTEQELKDAWDGDSKKGKEKALQNSAYRGTTDEELKSMINDYGLTYETESQIIAESEANDIIERIGLDNAFKAVQNGYIKGAQAAVIYAKVVDDVEAKLQKGDLTEQEQTKLKEIQAFLIDMFDSEARDAGRFIAMLKRTNHKSLFNYDTMVKYAEESKGKPLTEEEKLQIKEQSEKIKELDKRIAELETALEEERVNNAIQNIKAQTQKNKVSVTFRAKSKGLADKVRKLKTKELVLKDADGNPIKLTQNSIVSYNDIIELVAKTIEKTGELIDGINTALDEIKKQEWYQKLSQRDKDAVDKQVKQDILDLDDDVSDDKFKIPHSLIRDIVKNGTEDIEGIVKKVKEVYEDIYPDLDKRKIRDIITKYGEKVDDKRDTIDKKISLAKRIGRLLSAKDDLLNGKLPERSGLQRDKPNPQERLLMQEIQQLLKNIPKSQEEIDALWTSALEKVKARYKNRIEELQLAIDKAERIKKTKNVQNYNDADLDKLKEQLKQKQSEYDEKFPKEKTTLSDEQRLNQIINSKKKRLEFLKQQRIDKVYERTKKDGVDKSKYPELSKQIADLEAQIKAENEDIKKDEDYKKYIEKKRIALAIKANQRRIEELQRRIKEKDFTVKKNPTPVSDELDEVKKEKQKIVDDYEHAKHKFELENRTGWQKIFDGIIEVLSFTKQAKATFDLSAPLRQGATVMFSNPMIFGKAIKEMHRQAWSDEFYKETIEKIQDSENYTLAQDSGLEITDVDSINERKRDEQYVSKLMDSEFMKKTPIFARYRAMNKGSERAYSGFLNNIRFNLFEQGVKELESAGYKFEDNPIMFKALATTINNLTGRGLSPTGKMGKVLNFFLFSPKMLTSRFLLAYDLVRKDIPFNSPSRIMAAKSLLGTVAWIGMFNVLGSAVSKALSDDDKEKKKSLLKKINYNPIATDFAKVRDKQTTFDPTAGYAPLVRTLVRMVSEKSINSSGNEKDLTRDRNKPAREFIENKLSPIASFAWSLWNHDNPANKFEKSDNAEWYDYLTPLFVPLTVMQISENWNDKDNFGKDFIELGLGLYGIGVAQYDNTGTGKGKSNSRTSERSSSRENSSRTTSRNIER